MENRPVLRNIDFFWEKNSFDKNGVFWSHYDNIIISYQRKKFSDRVHVVYVLIINGNVM